MRHTPLVPKTSRRNRSFPSPFFNASLLSWRRRKQVKGSRPTCQPNIGEMAFLWSVALPQPHARPAAVLGDELNAVTGGHRSIRAWNRWKPFYSGEWGCFRPFKARATARSAKAKIAANTNGRTALTAGRATISRSRFHQGRSPSDSSSVSLLRLDARAQVAQNGAELID